MDLIFHLIFNVEYIKGEYIFYNFFILTKGRSATMEELSLVHSKDYIDSVKSLTALKLQELDEKAADYSSVYLHNETWSSACISAGSLLQVVDAVLNGECQSGVAIVRPPGHHAEEDAACGFCIFNNVAVAATYAVQFHHVKKYDTVIMS